MADTGWQNGGTSDGSRGSGTYGWTPPDNVLTDGSGVASVTIITALASSRGLAVSNFSLAGDIPAGSTIDGIEIQVDDYRFSSGTTFWNDLRLILADDSDGTQTRHSDINDLSTSNQTDIAGAPTQLWGETIERSDVIDVDWGTYVRIWDDGGGSSVTNIDWIAMKVYYSETTPTITDVNGTESWTDGDTGLVITGTIFV